jgi:hypothetical protein
MRGFSEAVAYAPRHIASDALPSHVDLRAHGLSGPTKDQGGVGACAAFALSTTMDNAARRLGRGDVIAPLHVFSLYTLEDDANFSRAVRARPVTTEPVWPWDPARACRMADSGLAEGCGNEYGVTPGSAKGDPRLMSEKQRADAMGALQIAGYEYLSTEPVDLDQIALIVASGEALYAGFAFDRSAWESLSGGRTARFQPYADGDGIGHAVTIEGYRPTPTGREFLLHNSWGRDWGRGGYGWMDEQLVRAHLRSVYRVLVVDGTVSLPKPQQHCTSGRVPILEVCAPDFRPLPSLGTL